jgi:hypothetical protein
VLVSKVPKRVEPVTKSVDDVIVCATIVCAVRVPLTKKLSADDAVAANDADTAFNIKDDVAALFAQLEVPNNDPVNP